MGVLKNDVGRPSNKTIMIRRILKGLLVIILAAAIFAGGYIINNNNIKSFDTSKVTTKRVENTEDGIAIYVYGKKLKIDTPITKLNKVGKIDDIGVIWGTGIDLSFIAIVDTKANILYSTINNKGDVCYKDISDECYGFKIKDNKITYYVNYFMTSDMVCDYGNTEEKVLSEFEIVYKNGKLSKPKDISVINALEYINKHNIQCSYNTPTTTQKVDYVSDSKVYGQNCYLELDGSGKLSMKVRLVEKHSDEYADVKINGISEKITKMAVFDFGGDASETFAVISETGNLYLADFNDSCSEINFKKYNTNKKVVDLKVVSVVDDSFDYKPGYEEYNEKGYVIFENDSNKHEIVIVFNDSTNEYEYKIK